MRRTITVQVRLTAEEHKRWLAVAVAEDRTLSNWIRRQCNANDWPTEHESDCPAIEHGADACRCPIGNL